MRNNPSQPFHEVWWRLWKHAMCTWFETKQPKVLVLFQIKNSLKLVHGISWINEWMPKGHHLLVSERHDAWSTACLERLCERARKHKVFVCVCYSILLLFPRAKNERKCKNVPKWITFSWNFEARSLYMSFTNPCRRHCRAWTPTHSPHSQCRRPRGPLHHNVTMAFKLAAMPPT